MNYQAIFEEMNRNKEVFSKMLSGITPQEYLWQPQPGKWSLLEIICHLYDEERDDFRARTKHLLENPGMPLPPADPVSWVMDRKYLQQNYNDKLNQFLFERDQSLQWLNSLENTGWNNSYRHPKVGDITAKMILINWLAHDYLHFRQITKLKFDRLKLITSESLNYAGEW